ncbi:putative P-loop containing nucleoside triphosphate hydrolase, leucine-rich repeat domain superfamily [Helianthus debilis subsp. tardiflorus]
MEIHYHQLPHNVIFLLKHHHLLIQGTVVRQKRRCMLKLLKMSAMLNPREMMTVLNMIEVQMKMFQLQLRVIQLPVQARMDLNVNHQGRLLILMQKGQHLRVIPVSYEAKCIKEIVDTISKRLPTLTTNANKKLIGIEARLRDLKSKLKIGSDGVHMVGIWGVGGGGKTTLASAAYAELSHQFEGHCFLQNIREKLNKHGLEKLQEKFLKLVLKTKDIEVGYDLEGRSMIERKLRSKRVLVVLDDVDDVKQLEELAGSHAWFGKGSRIIVTTRDKHLLSTRYADEVYEVSLLSHDEAIELFSRHAFQNDKPTEDYEMLSEDVVSYAGGLPLALEILGSFLYDKDRDEWKCALARLKDIPDDEVTKRLKISYGGLKTMEKDLFLDIACFFRGMHKDYAMKVLEACNLHPGIGIKVLVQKSLIKVVDGGFEMHDLIEEMAHYIVRGEHPNHPEKHSRIWNREDLEELCAMGAAAPSMETEVLAFSGSIGDLDLPDVACLSDVCTNMKKLRYIRFDVYPTSLPSNFQPTKLRCLELGCSQQKELWHGYKRLPNLKYLRLSGYLDLMRTPDFEGLPCLERLILWGCESLEEIHPSIGYHKSLVFVDMSYCERLKRFPPIKHMKKLETLDLSFCLELQEFPDIQSNMDSLVTLHLHHTDIEIIPPSVGRFCTNLVSFNLSDCPRLKRIEGNFHLLKSLKDLNLYGCIGLQSFHQDRSVSLKLPQFPHSLRKLDLSECNLGDGDIPSDICELSNLQLLGLSENQFSRLPSSISRLPCLKYLNISYCRSLVELPNLPSSIAILKANQCNSLESVGDLSDYKWLWKATFCNCFKLIDGGRALLSMREGNAAKDRFMSVVSPDVQPSSIFMGFVTLQLPHNWHSDFSGFLLLLCDDDCFEGRRCIAIKQEMSTDHPEKFNNDWEPYGSESVGTNYSQESDEDREQCNYERVGTDYSEESDEDQEQCNYERVGYVPFSSLSHIPWLNPTYTKNLSFKTYRGGLNVKLVSSKSKMGDSNEHPSDYSECWDEEDEDFTTFEIIYDSKSSEIQISWIH